MTWGTFTTQHILTLLLAIIIVITIYYIAKHLKEPYRKIFLLILALSGDAAIIYNLVSWGSPLEYLPLELCSFNAMLLPIVVLTKNKVLGNCLQLWALGALMALVMNNGVANFEIKSWVFFFYYFPHVIEFGLPFILAKLNYIELDKKCIKTTLLITIICYTIAHISNITLNQYFIKNDIRDYLGNIVQVNYMFSVTQNNPALELFYKIIPYDYWYLYLITPFVVIYLEIIYFFDKRRKKKNEIIYNCKA